MVREADMSAKGCIKSALTFTILAECRKSNARTGIMKLPHFDVETPVFMPVGTQGSMKGILPEQLECLDYQIILGNTYHLGTRPGIDVIEKAGGLHKFMNWNRALLTDSGGFQMVSLLKLADITEEGVKFISPYNGKECMLTPEHSIKIQNVIGADIIMQLDDVVKTTTVGPRVEEATHRTSRWLDRCLEAHAHPERQNIFPIVQGGLDPKLRTLSAKMHAEREVNGYAIGGLSGGECKEDFWNMVYLCTKRKDEGKDIQPLLPREKPRYVMGVGFAVDIVVCCALGVDMFDCVFPTRTAVPDISRIVKVFSYNALSDRLKGGFLFANPQLKRFGCALVDSGQLNLKKNEYAQDFSPIDNECNCSTCSRYSRAFLHTIVGNETVACHLLSVHNLAYQMRLMKSIRESIKSETFPEFVIGFMKRAHPSGEYPKWVLDSLSAVDIHLQKEET